MNEDLKTLKDLEDNCLLETKDGEQLAGFIERKRLKQEAIKWIKADKSHFYSKNGKEETILWIKEFFNITEDDL